MDKKSLMGYRKDSPYKSAPYLDIFTENGMIDMSATDKDLLGIDEYGNTQIMTAGNTNPYRFEGQRVREIPMQQGGSVNALYKYLYEDDDESEQAPVAQTQVDEEMVRQNAFLTEENASLRAKYEKDMQDQEDLMAAMSILSEIDTEDPPAGAIGTAIGGIGSSVISGANPANLPVNTLNPDTYLTAIFGSEGGTTGVVPKGLAALGQTARGRFGLIDKTRKEMYSKYYKGQMTFDEFEKSFKSDANFEYGVARKLAEEKLRKSKTIGEAIGSWYYPAFAHSGRWDEVPEPKAGNNRTLRQYINIALKNLR